MPTAVVGLLLAVIDEAERRNPPIRPIEAVINCALTEPVNAPDVALIFPLT
jgi:hypothetical protein